MGEEMTSVKSITGYHDHLYEHMKESFKKAKKVDIIVSFLMESGVKLLENELREIKNRLDYKISYLSQVMEEIE